MSNKCLAPLRDLSLLWQGIGKEEHIFTPPLKDFPGYFPATGMFLTTNTSHHFFELESLEKTCSFLVLKTEQVCPLFCLQGSKNGATDAVLREGHLQTK